MSGPDPRPRPEDVTISPCRVLKWLHVEEIVWLPSSRRLKSSRIHDSPQSGFSNGIQFLWKSEPLKTQKLGESSAKTFFRSVFFLKFEVQKWLPLQDTCTTSRPLPRTFFRRASTEKKKKYFFGFRVSPMRFFVPVLESRCGFQPSSNGFGQNYAKSKSSKYATNKWVGWQSEREYHKIWLFRMIFVFSFFSLFWQFFNQ